MPSPTQQPERERWIWQLEGVRHAGLDRARLEGITLEIRDGVTAVMGPSGAGKTSLLNLLVGFEEPAAGRLSFRRPEQSGAPLFWSPPDHGLWPHMSVEEHLRAVAPAEPDGADASTRDLLAAFDLVECGDLRPERLSQGQCSRLSVARALASGATLLVLDEPLVHVDRARARSYWRWIRDHLRRRAASLVFATHDPETVLAEAQRVICLDGGRLRYDGDVESLYERPSSEDLARCLGRANWFEPGGARALDRRRGRSRGRGVLLAARAARGPAGREQPSRRASRAPCRHGRGAGRR